LPLPARRTAGRCRRLRRGRPGLPFPARLAVPGPAHRG